MKVSVDSTKCQGHGRCFILAPEAFTFDDEGFAFADNVAVDPKVEDACRSAALNCPEGAVDLHE